MAESTYPVYHTRNGVRITAYVVEAIGLVGDYDDGEANYVGKNGVIGSYRTAEEAIAVARREKNATCTIRVTDTRNEPEPVIIFVL